MEDSLFLRCQYYSIGLYNPNQNLSRSFVDIDKLILKCSWKGKGTRVVTTICEKKHKVGRVTLLDFKSHYKAVSWVKAYIDQQSKIKSLEKDPQKYGQLIFDRCKAIHVERIAFSIYSAEAIQYPYVKMEPCSIP